MKSNVNSKIIILIALGILFAFSPISKSYLIYNSGNNKIISEYEIDSTLDYENLKISATSGKIHIDGNSGWVAFKNAGNCTGNGTYSDPYIIEGLVIDGVGSGSCILIQNSEVYFKIENCTFYNSGFNLNMGISFSYVNNSLLTNNNCSNNYHGIDLYNSYNNTISTNTIYDNDKWGIYLSYSFHNNITGNTAKRSRSGIRLSLSDNNILSGNTANNNFRGIHLSESDYNTVLGNTANNNHYEGVHLFYSDFNTISGNNLLGNEECIVEENCEGNIFENNDCGIIPGYNLFFLICTMSVVIILIIKKLKKS